MVEPEKRRGVGSRTAAALAVWGNWYILRTSHEFGWGSQWAVLNYHEAISNGHKILFDAPETVRLVDMAVGQLHEWLRRCLVLKYCWHRDIRGVIITDAMRADSMDLTVHGYRSLVKVALRRVDAQISAKN